MMTSLLNGNVFKISIILFFVSSLLMVLVTKVRKMFTKNKMQAIVYAIVLMLLFGLTGLLSYYKILNDSPTISYVSIETVLFILGIGHIFVLRSYFKELSEDKSELFGELIFTMAFLGIGLLALVQIVSRFRAPFSLVYLSAGIAFIIPLLVLKLYEFASLIPVPVYKEWFFPLGNNIKEPTNNELSNPIVINFAFKKRQSDKEVSRFTVKAPEHMEFGRFFYFFVDDYNALHPETQIEIAQSNGEFPGWNFYFKPYWWNAVRYIDANKTVEWNGIREGNDILVERVVPTT